MKKIKILIITLILFFINTSNTYCKESNLVNIYIFHSDYCEHCKEEIKLLNDLEEKYDNIKIYKYEINNSKNKELFNKVANFYNTNSDGVPFTIIGNKYFIGYSDEKTPSTFIKTIIYYSEYGYIDKVAPIVGNNNIPSLEVMENQIEIDDFIENYGNYKIFFFNTKDLNIETTNILTSILTEINIYNILMLVILSLIINKIKNNKDKLLTASIYIVVYLIMTLFYNLNIELITNTIILITLNYFVYSVLFYIVKNKIIHIIYSISAIIASISNYLKITYRHKYLDIFKETLNLNNINIIEYINQMIISLVINIFVTVILLYLIYNITSKIKKVAIKK